MRRALLCLMLTVLAATAGADTVAIDPWLRSRLGVALADADTDVPKTLERLAALERTWRRNPKQLAFIVRETAAVLTQAGRLDEARAKLEDILADQPDDFAPALRLGLGTVLLMLEEVEASLKVLETWRAHEDEPDPQGLLLLGYGYIQTDRFTAAIDVLEAAFAATAKPQPRMIELLAYAYGRAGRASEAVALLEGLIESNPAQARWWRQLAGVYQLSENVDRGAATLSVLDQVETLRFSDARYLARVLAYLEMPYEAAILLDDAMASAEAVEFDHRMLLAHLWIQARELDRAVPALREAATLAPDGEPLFLLAQLYLHWERYPEALTTLAEAIRAYGEEVPPNAYYLQAIAAINDGQPAVARLALTHIEEDAAYTRRVASLRRHLTSQQIKQR